MASEPRERSEPAKRLASERVGESEGRSPSENNVEQGKQMLRDSGLNFTTADTMSEAAEKVVALGK